MALQGASFHFSTMKYQANTPRIPACFTLNKSWLYTVGTTFISLVGSSCQIYTVYQTKVALQAHQTNPCGKHRDAVAKMDIETLDVHRPRRHTESMACVSGYLEGGGEEFMK